ncbi:MAG TPA: hypothetical protein PLF75_10990, partial [Bacteroidales bacterium]|nr:hypothetical protein [Bacteroidales bacterium]
NGLGCHLGAKIDLISASHRLCRKVMGLEKGATGRPCFARQLKNATALVKKLNQYSSTVSGCRKQSLGCD